MAQDDMVWVDDGQGPILAAWAKNRDSRMIWIREPKQVKASEVRPGMDILDEKTLKIYREAIDKVKKRNK